MTLVSSKALVLIGYMVFAMFAFAVCDVGIKMMGNTLPISQILFLMGTVSAAFVGAGAIARGKQIFDAKVFEPLFILRTLLEFIGGLAFISAFVFGSLRSPPPFCRRCPWSSPWAAPGFLASAFRLGNGC